MKIFKFILTLLVAGALLMLLDSCSQDSNVLPNLDINKDVELKGGKIAPNQSPFTGVQNVGNWLYFESFRTMDNIEEVLVSQIDRYVDKDDPREDDSVFKDDSPVLAQWEAQLRHRSLRLDLLEQEWRLLQARVRPDRALNSLDDKGIVFDVRQAFLNPDGVVQVGKSIYISGKDKIIEVKNNNTRALRDILKEGMVAIYNPIHIKDIKIHHFGGGLSTAPDCTADFTLTQTENDSSYTATFTWATNPDINDLSNVNLTWDFGDGSDKETSEFGMITHTYSSAGEYTVCLEVSWDYEEDGEVTESCSDMKCMTIEIEEEIDPGEVLCDILQVISFFSIDDVTQLFVDENSSTEGKLCMSTTGLLNIFADAALDVEASEIQFTLVETGETVTGSGCFTISCNTEFQVKVNIGSCTVIFDIDYNGFIDKCDDDNSETDWLWEEFVDEEKAISYKLKTKSKENNFLGGCNCVWAEMHNYEKKNGNWKKKKKNLKLEFCDEVYLDNNCDCDDSQVVNAYKEKNRKHINKQDKVEADVDGISAHETYPWHTHFYVEGQFIVKASPFD